MREDKYQRLDDQAGEKINWRQKMHERFHNLSKIFYPNRPILTLCIGLAIFSIGYLGILPFGFILTLGAGYIYDDIIITPALRLIKLVQNLWHGEKQLKSVLGIIAILGGYVGGALLAYFVFLSMPAVLALIPAAQTALGCLTITGIGFASTLVFARLFHMPALYLMFPAIIIFPLIPVPAAITASIELVVASSLLGAFLASLVSKQLIRLAYKIFTGRSNSDSYIYVEDEQLFQKQANFYGLTLEAFKGLKDSAVKVIESVQRVSPWYTKINGPVRIQKNTFRDIIHKMLNGHTDEDKESLKVMLETGAFVASDRSRSWTMYSNVLANNALHVYGDSQWEIWKAAMAASGNSYSHSKNGARFKLLTHRLDNAFALNKCECLGDQESKQAAKEYRRAAGDVRTALIAASI